MEAKVDIMDESTTIKVTKSTRDRLLRYGKMGDTYEEVLSRILDEYEEIKMRESKKKENPLEAVLSPALA